MLGTLASPAIAQEQGLDVTGSVRVRGEALDGQPRIGITSDDHAVFIRVRLGATYTSGPFAIGGEVIDSRAYLEPRESTVSASEVDALEPVQAWIQIAPTRNAKLRLGRFTMNLGSGRLIVDENFRNTTNGFTGARFDWSNTAGDALTAFWTMPQQRLPDDDAGIRADRLVRDRERTALQFYGAIATKAGVFGGELEGYAFRLQERDAPDFLTRNRRLWTLGARLANTAAPGRTDYELEAVWQSGTARLSSAAADTTDRRVSAVFVHGGLGYTLPGSWKPRLRFAADYASGNGRGDDQIGRFDTLYGARSFEFAPSGLYGEVARANLISIETRLELVPAKRTDAYFAVRPLWLADATDSFGQTGVRDPSGASGLTAGTQFETRVRWWAVPERVRMAAGGVYLAKGRFLRVAPNAPATGDTRYAYAEVTYSF
ncbi:alginate export family protein [Sphingomonas sp. CFBP 13603]|uniref:alginate export family protein n=1 Tax=Sphingomonas sp. CFBP 13603 TaxID=2774040 RepID=UPI0018674879|nr:alginate export family protein [Sphingomonas sp. CFBP 13603]